jgi:hypothetical protein
MVSLSPPDPRTAASLVLVQRALDWYIAEAANAESPPISAADARQLRLVLQGSGAGAWQPELFDRVVVLGQSLWKLQQMGLGPGSNVGDGITALASVDVAGPGAPRWTFDATASPEAFARLEFRETSIGIEKAQRDHREGWWAHAQRNRAFISEAIKLSGSRRLAVVLGAGAPFDLPLAELGKSFERLVLVDIDADALATTVKGVWKDPADRARVQTRAVDLTGINTAWVQRVDEVLAAPGTADEIEAAMRRLCLSYRMPALPAPLWGPPGERADLVVSSCVITQLGWPQRTYAEAGLEKRFGRLTAAAEQRLATAFSEMALRVQQDHINALGDGAELVCLTSDVVSHRTVLDATGSERDSGRQVLALGVESLLERLPASYQVEKHAQWPWSRYKPSRKGTEGSRMAVEGVILKDRWSGGANAPSPSGLWLPGMP